MSGCEAFQNRLLDDQDAGAAAHVGGCASCAAEQRTLREAVNAVVLSPPSAVERQSLSHFPSAVLSAWRRAQVRRMAWQRVATLSLVAAAAALMVVMWPFVHGSRSIGAPLAPESTESEVSDPVALTGVAFTGDGADDWNDDGQEEGTPPSDAEEVDL
jgi:hypothetical protein